jgi:hypothetical protein
VRHEAGEALGAIGRPECLAALRAHCDDAAPEVAETCRLALQRIEWLQAAAAASGSSGGSAAAVAADGSGESPYMSVDPTPPLPADTPVEKLRAILLDPSERMFDVSGCVRRGGLQAAVLPILQWQKRGRVMPWARGASVCLNTPPPPGRLPPGPCALPHTQRYRALFALRNRGGDAEVAVLCEALSASSALLKHEVAYVLGQLQHARSVPTLGRVLRDVREHPM